MNADQIQAIVAAAVAAALKGSAPKAAKVKANKAKPAAEQPRNAEGLTAKQVENNQKVVKAFKKLGLDVTPRVTVKNYNGWIASGRKVRPGEKSTFVKGVGSMFHIGQTDEFKPEAEAKPAEAVAQATPPKAAPVGPNTAKPTLHLSV